MAVDDLNGTSVPGTPVPGETSEASGGLPADAGALASAEAAEEVRAWLVDARGGATFLSPTDGALLVSWLDAGVPVSDICCAIERTAARRIAKRTRTPFTLASCRTELSRARVAGKAGSGRASPRGPAALPVLHPPTLELVTDPALLAREGALVARTHAALGARSEGDRVQEGCRIVHAFHVALWDLLAPARPALLAHAAACLEAVAVTLDEAAFHQLCEEWARASVRARHPALTAAAIYEEAVLGG